MIRASFACFLPLLFGFQVHVQRPVPSSVRRCSSDAIVCRRQTACGATMSSMWPPSLEVAGRETAPRAARSVCLRRDLVWVETSKIAAIESHKHQPQNVRMAGEWRMRLLCATAVAAQGRSRWLWILLNSSVKLSLRSSGDDSGGQRFSFCHSDARMACLSL